MPVEVTLKWSDTGHSDVRSEDVFQVTGVNNESEAKSANGPPWGQVPQLNSSHRYNSNQLAEHPFVRRSGFNIYDVLVSYSIPESGSHSDPGGNPLDEPWEIGFDVAIGSESTDSDVYTNPLLNSARDVYDPPPTTEYYEWTILLTHNEASFNFAQALAYKSVINSDVVSIFGYIFPVACLKCVKLLPTHRYKQFAPYINMGVELKFREPFGIASGRAPTLQTSPFHHWLLDRGYNGWYNDGGLKAGRILDSKLQPVTMPVLLDAQGTPLDSRYTIGKADEGHAAVPAPTAGGGAGAPQGAHIEALSPPGGGVTGYYLVYDRHGFAPFSALNLPT